MYEKTVNREKKSKTPGQALASLMRLASRSEKSSGDARRLMLRWGLTGTDADEVLKRLIDDKFIDDARYAAAYVRDKVNFSGWGEYKIRRMLAGKGIAKHLIDEAIRENMPHGKDGRLLKILSSKAEKTKAKDVYDLKAKLLRYAAGLGYDYETVIDAINRVIKE